VAAVDLVRLDVQSHPREPSHERRREEPSRRGRPGPGWGRRVSRRAARAPPGRRRGGSALPECLPPARARVVVGRQVVVAPLARLVQIAGPRPPVRPAARPARGSCLPRRRGDRRGRESRPAVR
jgi:hypothetical protein